MHPKEAPFEHHPSPHVQSPTVFQRGKPRNPSLWVAGFSRADAGRCGAILSAFVSAPPRETTYSSVPELGMTGYGRRINLADVPLRYRLV